MDGVGLYETGHVAFDCFTGVFNSLAISKYFWRLNRLGSAWRNFSLRFIRVGLASSGSFTNTFPIQRLAMVSAGLKGADLSINH